MRGSLGQRDTGSGFQSWRVSPKPLTPTAHQVYENVLSLHISSDGELTIHRESAPFSDSSSWEFPFFLFYLFCFFSVAPSSLYRAAASTHLSAHRETAPMAPGSQPSCLSCSTWLTCPAVTLLPPQKPPREQHRSVDQPLERPGNVSPHPHPCSGKLGLVLPTSGPVRSSPLSADPQGAQSHMGSGKLTTCCNEEMGENKSGGWGEVTKVLEFFERPVVLSSGLGFFAGTRCPSEEAGMLSPANEGPPLGWSQPALLPWP